jgi:putative ABC transport system substrate-binding protein
MAIHIRRREFIVTLSSAAAWPLAARAQQRPMPVIGFLDSRSPDAVLDRLRGFHQGLKDNGFMEGDNVTIVYRWAENQLDRLPEMAAELVRRQVAVLAATGPPAAAFAAKAATATIPIVFLAGQDPVRLGLVTSLARPEANLTGVNFLNTELVAKQLELLRELVPRAGRIALLINPVNPATAESTVRDAELAARMMGVQIQLLRANTSRELDTAFTTLARERPDAMFVPSDAFFAGRRVQLVQLVTHHRIPAMYTQRDFPEIGGLMSYGSNIVDAFRQVGVYCGRLLKGAKPADLPVVQSSKFELVINASTARMLGLTVPDKLLVAADEVIE